MVGKHLFPIFNLHWTTFLCMEACSHSEGVTNELVGGTVKVSLDNYLDPLISGIWYPYKCWDYWKNISTFHSDSVAFLRPKCKMHRSTGVLSGFFSLLRHGWAPLQPPCRTPSVGRPRPLSTHRPTTTASGLGPASSCSFSENKAPPSSNRPVLFFSPTQFHLPPASFCFPTFPSFVFFFLPDFLRGLNLWGDHQVSGPTTDLCTR